MGNLHKLTVNNLFKGLKKWRNLAGGGGLRKQVENGTRYRFPPFFRRPPTFPVVHFTRLGIRYPDRKMGEIESIRGYPEIRAHWRLEQSAPPSCHRHCHQVVPQYVRMHMGTGPPASATRLFGVVQWKWAEASVSCLLRTGPGDGSPRGPRVRSCAAVRRCRGRGCPSGGTAGTRAVPRRESWLCPKTAG